MTTGLIIGHAGLELLVDDERVGSRRLEPSDIELLASLTSRYARAVYARSDPSVFIGLGRELFRWLDGDQKQLSVLLERASHPLVFEVRGPRSPSERAWAVLHAPFELLAWPDGGFLVGDSLARFSVVRRLGEPIEPPMLDQNGLGIVFMASAPRGYPELDFEAEEAAVLAAVAGSPADLVVESSGDPAQLESLLAELGGMPVVHLSCYAANGETRPGEPPVPLLLLESPDGGARPTTTDQFARWLSSRPRLLFLSVAMTAARDVLVRDRALGTADSGLVAHSLSAGLAAAGMPAVIGWDGLMSGRSASEFAEQLYRQLARGADLAVATGDARRALLVSQAQEASTEWHLARLWLGPAGGGRLVSGSRRRSLVPAAQGTKAFLANKPQVPVAATGVFVDRRAELQQALRALSSGQRAGVLLHGQAGLGKSSLAARIADRCPQYAVAVVSGDYSAAAITAAVVGALRRSQPARDLLALWTPKIRQRPDAIAQILADLFAERPQPGGGDRPLLLIIDDLDRILVQDPDGPHRVAPASAPVLAAVLRAFSIGGSDSRLLITSRFSFALEGLESRLEVVQLQPFVPAAQRKLLSHQQALVPAERSDSRANLAERALAVSGGNPGLQDLLVRRLVYGDHVSLERAEAAVSGMETYLRRGKLPDDRELRGFLDNLALDSLVDEAGPRDAALLRAVTLFDLPVPERVVEVLTDVVGGSASRLRGLGLLVSYADTYDRARRALAVDPLASGRLTQLSSSEQADLAAAVLKPLFAAWGGSSPHPPREQVLDLQLTRLALLADDAEIAHSCATAAVAALRVGSAGTASQLGEAVVEMLDSDGVGVPLNLLRQTADAALASGDGPAGEALLDRAAQQVGAGNVQDASLTDQAHTISEQARHLITKGRLEEAERLLRQARRMFTSAGSDSEAATVMGVIGDIAFERGDYEEALRIYTELQLPLFERLGNTQQAADTWAKVADIAYQRGDYDEALRITREVQLPVYERLGDARSAAVAWGKIADIATARGDLDEALRIRREIQLPAFERLGDTRSLAIAWGEIGDIAYQRGDYDEAAELQRKRLDANRRLGDLDGVAAANWDLARIDLARQDYTSAFPRLMESFQILQTLQRPDGIAIVGAVLGQLLLTAGNPDPARRVLEAAQTAAAKIGSADAAAQLRQLVIQATEAAGTE